MFLLRKMLPSTPPPLWAHREKICTASPKALPPGYLAHVRRITKKIFKRAWDCAYANRVAHFIPPISSALQASRKSGGARSFWVGRRDDFLKQSLHGPDPDLLPEDFVVRYMNVECDGKTRGVTVADAQQHLLGPLHRTIYDRLSKESWLLRGEAKPSSFAAFEARKGEVYVSGDYTSATDNLPLEVAEVILQTMRKTSRCVPDTIWDWALRSLRAKVQYEDLNVLLDQVQGQLMGNLLSFPLLCIQNYAAFRWVCPGSVPVYINGDDIVFRAPRAMATAWCDTVKSLGLELCVGKTLVNSRVFSLNSTFFLGHFSGRIQRLPVLRPACLSRVAETPHSIGAACGSFLRGFVGEARVRAETLYLKCRAKLIVASGRSVLRDLRAPVSFEALVRSGLLRREAWYLSSDVINPLPLDKLRMEVSQLPEGWRREPLRGGRSVRRSAKLVERDFFAELNQKIWSEEVPNTKQLSCEVWEQTKKTGWEEQWRWWRRHHRRAGKRFFGRFGGGLRSRLRLSNDLVRDFALPPREPKVWVRGPEYGVEPLVFEYEDCHVLEELAQAGVLSYEDEVVPIDRPVNYRGGQAFVTAAT
jgi:hypothetical protein